MPDRSSTGSRRRYVWYKTSFVAFTLALLAAVLSGCGGGTSENAGSENTGTDSPPATAASETTGGDPEQTTAGATRDVTTGQTASEQAASEQAAAGETTGKQSASGRGAAEQTAGERAGSESRTAVGETAGGTGEGNKPDAVRGIYVPGYAASGPELEETLSLAERTGINALVVDVKDGGKTTYASDVPLAQEIGATSNQIPDLSGLVDRLHGQGIYAIARLAVFQDDTLARARPEYAVLDSTTGAPWLTYGGAAWTNPYRQEVWDYNLAIAEEAAAAGFDEIQFDYVRFPSDGPMANLAYGEETYPTQSDAIAAFLANAQKDLDPSGADISADVFGLVGVNDWVGVGQVVSKMVPHLDVLCPMVYPSHYPPAAYGYQNPNAYPYEVVDRAMADFQAKAQETNPEVEIRPWLQDFDYGTPDYGPAEVEAQMRAVRDSGLTGWLLWNAASEYTEEALDGTQQ